MSQYRPAMGDLLAVVRELLDATAPQVGDEARYKLQVASYLLGICEREQAYGAQLAAGELAAYGRLLGREGGDGEALGKALCAEIRAGRFDRRLDGVIEILLAHAIEDVRVVRPDHLGAGHAAVQRAGEPIGTGS